MKKKTNQIIQILEKTIDLIEKCGGPGGTMGPCPGGSGSPGKLAGLDISSLKIPKIPGVKMSVDSSKKDWQDPSTGEIHPATRINLSYSQGRGKSGTSSLTLFGSEKSGFGFSLAEMKIDQGYETLQDAAESGFDEVSKTFGKK